MGCPNRKVHVLFLCLSLSLALLSACAVDPPLRTPEQVRNDGALRVAASSGNDYPYLYWDENGRALGIEAEITRRLAAAMGAEAEFIAYDRETVVAAVENGGAEMGVAGFFEGSTGGGCAETAGYYVRRHFVLSRRDEPYPTESVMAGRTVLSDYTCDFDFAEQTDINTAAARLLDRTADAVICDEYAALAAAAEHGEELQAEYYQNSYEVVYVAVVARRNEKLYARLNGELTGLLEAGVVREIAGAYP